MNIIKFLFISLSLLVCVLNQAFSIETPSSKQVRFVSSYYTIDTGQKFPFESNNKWQKINFSQLPKQVTNLWLKIEVELESPSSNGLFLSVFASHKVYWDHKSIGYSGQLGRNKKEEIPGLIDTAYRIPDQLLTPGNHSLYIQISRHHSPNLSNTNFIDIAIAPYIDIKQQQILNGLIPFFLLGALLVIGIFSFNLRFGSFHYKNYLPFGLLCLLVAILMLAEQWRPIFSYPYHWHIWRIALISFLTVIIGLVLPWVVWTEFTVNKKLSKALWLTLIYGVLLIFIPSFDLSALVIIQVALFVSILPFFNKPKTKKLEDYILVFSIAICLLSSFKLSNFMEFGFFILFSIVMIAILNKLAQSIKHLQQSLYQQDLINEQLKLELLKRHMQPHFLMNTLTSLAEWIEVSPVTAQELIEALAQEFRLLLAIVDRKKISISEELKLCYLHTQVMSLRQDKCFTLAINNTISEFYLPPGVLHTLIENSISHTQSLPIETLEINVNIETLGELIIVDVYAPLANTKSNSMGLGTGKKYINTRLTSLFGHAFNVAEYATTKHWHTKLQFPLLLT